MSGEIMTLRRRPPRPQHVHEPMKTPFDVGGRHSLADRFTVKRSYKEAVGDVASGKIHDVGITVFVLTLLPCKTVASFLL